MSAQIKCTNCGAVMTPGADGRTYACKYCEAEQQVAIDAEQIAAGLRLDTSSAASPPASPIARRSSAMAIA
jgi:DNA-directed RNA polymerase subunit M/transcription elongation factor TFIIS